MTQRPRKEKGVEKISVDEEFRKIIEKNLRNQFVKEASPGARSESRSSLS